MKHEQKSLIVTIWLIKAMGLCLMAAPFVLPFLVGWYSSLREQLHAFYWPTLILAYLCLIPAGIAIVSMDRLMANIRKADVFIPKNTEHLRVLSWCAYAVAVVFFLVGCMRPIALVVAFAACFIGVILRVVKNVFAQAVAIREENEFTI